MNRQDFVTLIEKHPDFDCKVYIETGLWKGDRLVTAASVFPIVHGIELDEHWFHLCHARVAGMNHVTVHRGDTRDILPRLIAQWLNSSCCFYLDAHFCKTDPPIPKSEFPLWAELRAIRARGTKDIVLVNDVHTFGRARPDLRMKPDAVEWESVTFKSLRKFFGDQLFDCEQIADNFVIWRDGTGER